MSTPGLFGSEKAHTLWFQRERNKAHNAQKPTTTTVQHRILQIWSWPKLLNKATDNTSSRLRRKATGRATDQAISGLFAHSNQSFYFQSFLPHQLSFSGRPFRREQAHPANGNRAGYQKAKCRTQVRL